MWLDQSAPLAQAALVWMKVVQGNILAETYDLYSLPYPAVFEMDGREVDLTKSAPQVSVSPLCSRTKLT